MKLNKLPVLIRTEVTEAARSANLPSAYTQALTVLQEAIDDLSLAKLKQVSSMAEALASYAKASQDEQAVKNAKLLKYRYRRSAFWLAKQLAAQRKAEFIASGVSEKNTGQMRGIGVTSQLKEAGFSNRETRFVLALNKLPDTEETAMLRGVRIAEAARSESTAKRINKRSDAYYYTFGCSSKITPVSPGGIQWIRHNSARGIAKTITEPRDIEAARQRVELMRAWCDEFLKSLPRTVSKAKV